MASLLNTVAGRATPNAPRTRSQTEVWTEYARHAATALRNRTPLPEITVYGPVLNAGERALFQGSVNYARMYGGDGTYNTTGMFVLGNPAVMLGSFAAAGVINHRRKVRARRDAALQLRDHQNSGFIATNQRLLVHTSRGWGTYAYSAMTEFYPDLENWTLTIGFGDRGAPMLLNGPPVPAIALVVAAATTPDRWMHDPRLRGILGGPA
jgi:hypothetical protein